MIIFIVRLRATNVSSNTLYLFNTTIECFLNHLKTFQQQIEVGNVCHLIMMVHIVLSEWLSLCGWNGGSLYARVIRMSVGGE